MPDTLDILDDEVSAITAGKAERTIFGLTLEQLHARFWAARGVQVVCPGDECEIAKHAELYLLLPPGNLALFPLAEVMDTLNWVHPQLLLIRLHDPRKQRYREEVHADDADRFVGFRRIYGSAGRACSSPLRAALTPRRDIAQAWQQSNDSAGWRTLRRSGGRAYATVRGMFYDPTDAAEAGQFVQHLLRTWSRLGNTVGRPLPLKGHGWRDESATVSTDAQLIGPVWVGAGRTVSAGQTVIGPAIVWDDPAARPIPDPIAWHSIEPSAATTVAARRGPGLLRMIDRALQRGFDIVFSLIAIALTLPLYPLILAAIWLEDGRPFFFAHRRESRGGKPFGCIKFRSMRKNAEALKARLAKANRADGPQFFIPDDPRLTRVGKFLRKTNLDELPQFFNVLLGQMAVVGPRPSPYAENQYCPAWREARLSVRPGITGLWQVCRTRSHGADFQEWIRYDIEYVERRSLRLDLEILVRTVAMLIGFTR